jgi:trehalose-6-phosphate synthase
MRLMNRLVLISNRLPFTLEVAGGKSIVTPSTGGLATALAPVLRERGATWIGWPGTTGEIPKAPFAEAARDAGYDVVPVALNEAERDEFY